MNKIEQLKRFVSTGFILLVLASAAMVSCRHSKSAPKKSPPSGTPVKNDTLSESLRQKMIQDILKEKIHLDSTHKN